MQRFGQGSPYLRIKGILTTPEGKAAWNVMQMFPADDVHLYLFGPDGIYQNGYQPGNYFDSAGTQLASADGSAGLVLDAAVGVGADSAPPIDATWTRDATVSVAGNTFVYVNTPAANNGAYKAVPLTTGKTYRVTLTVSGYVSGSISAWLGNQQTGASNAMLQANGTLSFLVSPTVAYNGYFLVGTNTGTTSATVSLVSIKEVTGIHATQSTPGFKPTLRKGIVNLLTYSNDLTNADWSKNGLSLSGNTFIETTGAGARFIQQNAPVVSGQTYTAVVRVKPGGGRHLQIPFGASFLTNLYANFDLSLGSVGAKSGSVIASIADAGNGEYICCATATASATATEGAFAWVCPNPAIDGFAPSVVGSGAASLSVLAVGRFQGTLTAAQIIAAGGIPLTTTAPASSVTGVSYLEFGGDDYLASAPLAQVGDDYYECMAVAVDVPFSGYPFISCAGRNAGWTTSLGDVYVNPDGTVGSRAVDNTANAVYVSNTLKTVQRGIPFIVECEKVAGMVRLIVDGVPDAWAGTHVSNMTLTESRLGLGSAIRVFDRAFVKGQVSDADKAIFRKQAAAGIQL